MNTILFILISLLLQWNWGGDPPQFHINNKSSFPDNYVAKIHLLKKQPELLEIEGTFYNDSDKKIDIYYKLIVIKSGQSSSSSNQSGSLKVDGKSQVVLSKSTVNFNKEDHYKIGLRVFKNYQIIAKDSRTFCGDIIVEN